MTREEAQALGYLDPPEVEAVEAAWIEGEADDLRRWLMDETAPLPASVRAEVRAARELPGSTAAKPPPEPLALTLAAAAAALNVSDEFFGEHIKPELRLARRGRRQIVPVDELRRWLDANAARTLE